MPRPFAVIGFTLFVTSALLYDKETGVTAVAFSAFAVALVIALFSEKARNKKIIPAVAVSGAVACLLLIASETLVYQPALSYDGELCRVKAVLTDECEERYGNYYYEAEALTINGENSDMKLRFTFSNPVEAEAYDIIEGNFQFYVLGSSDEEYLRSYKSKGLFMGAYSYSEDFEVINVPESEKPFSKIIIDFRTAARNAIYKILPDDRGALAVALILGDKSRVPDDIIDSFNDVGITHLICVSGFHLSLWSFMILKILRKTGMNEKIADLVAIAGVIGFMLIAGLSYSVMRSGIMMLVYLIADIISRKRDSFNSLGFALTVIALYNPFAMGSAGLQLSALATLGLILYSQFFNEKIRNFFAKINPIFLRKILRYVCEAFLTTFAATAFILPIILKINNGFHFGIFIANPLAIPVSQACIILCAVGAVIGMIPIPLFNLAAKAGGFFVEMLIQIGRKTADMSFLSVKTDDETRVIILSGLIAIILLSFIVFRNKKSVPELTAVLCALYFTATMFIYNAIISNETRIRILDCGNGTSVLIQHGGENSLFGCGGTEFLGGARLTELIENSGGEFKNLVIPDTSEYNSCWFTDIVKSYKPEKIVCSDLPDGTKYLLSSSDVKEYLNYEDEHISCGETDNSRYAVYKNEDLSVLICFDPVDFEALQGEYDVIISRNDYPDGLNKDGCALAVISTGSDREIYLSEEIESKGIRSNYTAGKGNIVIKASDGALSLKREK